MRAALATRPHAPFLRGIEKEVLADPKAGPLYTAVPDLFVPLDGRRTASAPPRRSPCWVTVCAAKPLGSPGARLIILRLSAEPRLGSALPPLTART